jgi:hypothetical protein
MADKSMISLSTSLSAQRSHDGELEYFLPTLPPIKAIEFARAPRIARLHPGWILTVLLLAIVALARAGVAP